MLYNCVMCYVCDFVLLTDKVRRVQRQLKQVLQECDILLEVLDVRDPLGSRCYDIERQVSVGKIAKSASNAKPIILVLNKCDLVPASVVEAWISYFQNDYPVIAFYANQEIQALQAEGLFVKREHCVIITYIMPPSYAVIHYI